MREKSQVVATGETVVEAREEIAGRVMSAWKDLREWERLLWSRLCGFVGSRMVKLGDREACMER